MLNETSTVAMKLEGGITKVPKQSDSSEHLAEYPGGLLGGGGKKQKIEKLDDSVVEAAAAGKLTKPILERLTGDQLRFFCRRIGQAHIFCSVDSSRRHAQAS